MDFLLKIKIDKKKFIDLLEYKKEDDDIIYNIGNKILTLLFDFEKDDFEDENINLDDKRLKTENEDKNSENDGLDTDENPYDSKNEFEEENINDMIISFKSNIDEILNNYIIIFLKLTQIIMILIQKWVLPRKEYQLII